MAVIRFGIIGLFALSMSASGMAQAGQPAKVELTPATLPGGEAHIYREVQPDPLRLHVFKPADWKNTDRRPALLYFFGGGWTRGVPSAGWGKFAATQGLVGICADYRTKNRFGTSPLSSVADGRMALRWVQDHADELGIDPKRIVVSGSSSGGHVALWTAIRHAPPGSSPDESPLYPPCALILFSPVSDTTPATGYTPKRFGSDAEALSPRQELDGAMPRTLLFHGDADPVVPYRQSQALAEAIRATNASCAFITVPAGGHNTMDTPGWKDKTQATVVDFLREIGVSGKSALR